MVPCCWSFLLSWGLALSALRLALGYDLVRDYSGLSFYDGWDFYGGYDNLTLGDVVWLNIDDAFGQGLAYVNTAGNAVLKVDNTHNVEFNQKRNSIRITTQAAYAVGSLWISDMVHIPFGCSVWPAFWTMGPKWPDNGEIDIMEAINLMDHNQMALHTLPGCTHTTPPNQMGVSTELDCSQPAGCVVAETAPNSFQAGFAAAGGGVFAAQFDVAGIFIWFWSRPNIPPSILQATSSSPIDVSQWGPPSASFPATTCNITQFFSPQNLVLDITLCGIWAGLPVEYLPACGSSGPTGICYNDNVVGPGDRYNDAYFEIKYVRAYTTGGIAPTPTAAAVAIATAKATSTATKRPVGTALVPSPLFYPGGARRNMEHGETMFLVGLMVGMVMGSLLCWWP
ncbi:glycoside hydrolase family 16 protein [Lyophyllum atratum]|nr:glycoside hydrolase family 16 protein [Lyophyllum atratum]